MGKQWKQWLTLFWEAPKSLQMVTAAMKLKDTCSLGRKAMTNLDSILKVGYNFSSKEQASFNFLAAVTICSDFGASQNKVSHCCHCFPIYLP